MGESGAAHGEGVDTGYIAGRAWVGGVAENIYSALPVIHDLEQESGFAGLGGAADEVEFVAGEDGVHDVRRKSARYRLSVYYVCCGCTGLG